MLGPVELTRTYTVMYGLGLLVSVGYNSYQNRAKGRLGYADPYSADWHVFQGMLNLMFSLFGWAFTYWAWRFPVVGVIVWWIVFDGLQNVLSGLHFFYVGKTAKIDKLYQQLPTIFPYSWLKKHSTFLRPAITPEWLMGISKLVLLAVSSYIVIRY